MIVFKRALTLAATVVCLGLTGCGITYERNAQEFMRTQPESAWGAKPVDGYEAIQRAFVKARLKDPGSAQFEDIPLRRTTKSLTMTDPTVVPVWEATLLVNAKNGFGGYTGFKAWRFYYRNGDLFAVEVPDRGTIYTRDQR